jgi:Tfp pilus assembly protein PilF
MKRRFNIMLKRFSTVVVVLTVVGIIFTGLSISGCQQQSPKQVEAPKPQGSQKASSAKTETGPSMEVKEHIKQGLAYVSTAKNARDKALFEENMKNANKEFSLAIEKDPNYADAYSNRAVAYMQEKKFNKAMEDLKKAKELNPDSASIRYNFACLYSLKNDVDLSLDEIDAALEKGFNDYESLRKDPDLNNVRKHPEFKQILEKHKVFIMK